MPPPTNSSSLQKLKATCITPIGSNCVTWDGEDLPIIEICKGDSISDIEYKVALVIQKIQRDSDLTGLELSCLLGDCVSCPQPEKTVKAVITLLTEKVCSLEDIINSLNPSASSSLPAISLSCLSYRTAEGDLISSAQLDSATKLVIQQVCLQRDQLSTQGNILSNHETRITELEGKENNLVIPLVDSDCLFTGKKTIDSAYQVLDTDYCNYKSVVGTTSAFQQAFSVVCSGLNAKYGTINGWVPTPVTAAQYLGNLYIISCNLDTRVSYIETHCCANGCDSVVVGFIIAFNSNTCTLSFTSGAGTTIPDGFEDCGSLLTITNQDGVKATVFVTIAQDGVTDEIDLSAFTVGDYLTFSLASKMCSDSLRCEKCFSKTVRYTSSCCTVTNSGDDEATIIFTTKTATV